MEEARATLPEGGEPHLTTHVKALEGRLLAARHDARAVATLQEAVDGFAALTLPDEELECRTALVGACLDARLKIRGEVVASAGLRLAKRLGYERHVPALDAAMRRLTGIEGVLEEERPVVRSDEDPLESRYELLEELSSGGQGTV